jgi:inhibitor of KinA sporulation pathway (predicted exonuclease)
MTEFSHLLQQPFLVVFDTEYTTWEGAMARNWSGPNEHRELVQIGAVKLSTPDFSAVDTFECLVKPVRNPHLSDYFIKLTHITQAEVDTRGLPFAEAAARLHLFCQGGAIALGSYGTDGDVMHENARLHNAPLPPFSFHDLRPLFDHAGLNTKAHSSGTLYKALGLTLTGHTHNALFDATSLAVTLAELRKQSRI